MQIWDIAIVGGGTAGMTAAIYGARAGKKVVVMEELICGGQIVNASEVENYPGIKSISGAEFAASLYEQAAAAGASFDFRSVSGIGEQDGVKKLLTDGEPVLARTVILATGARNRPLGLEREEALTGKGVSYCATCDGAFYRGKVTAVQGGGNTALDDALVLSGLCQQVYLIHRRDEFRGERSQLTQVEARPNITILRSHTVSALLGEERLSGIRIRDLKDDTERELPVDGLFVAIGQMPQNERFHNLIELDRSGYIVAGEDCKTSCAGVFAAGDCRTKTVRQLSTAAGDGAVAALAALDFLSRS